MLHPVVVGSGKRFFNDGMDLTKFKLIESKPTSLGIVLLTHDVTK